MTEHAQITSQLNPAQRKIFDREYEYFKNTKLFPGFLKICSHLNPEQMESVLHDHKTDGPLLILACAGSGKTTALVYRIIFLLLKGVEPSQIIALTFTVKASEEMRARIRKFVEELWLEALPASDPGPILTEISKMWMGTFHSIALKILKENITGQYNCEIVNLRPGFGIIEDNYKIIKEAYDTFFSGHHKGVKYDDIASKIEHVKNELLDVETFKKKATRKEKTSAAIYERYQELLKNRGAIDFNDMLIYTVKLFREYPNILEHYHAKFKYVLVDEYQDTNYAQYTMCKLLVGVRQNFFCVGDDDQSIYGWRGADIRNILFFEKDYPQTTRIKLVKNYRSTATIISAANEIFRSVKPKHLLKIIEPLKNKFTGELDWGEKISVYHARDEHDEIKFVAFEINRLKSLHAGLNYGDFAILYRTNFQNKIIRKILDEEKIPCIIYDPRFWARPEVRHIKGYLTVLLYYCLWKEGRDIPKVLADKLNENIKLIMGLPPAKLKGEAMIIAGHLINMSDILTSDETFKKLQMRFGEESVDSKNLGRFKGLITELSCAGSFSDAVRGVIENSGLLLSYENKANLTKEEEFSYKMYKNLLSEAEDFEKITFAGASMYPLWEKIEIFLDSIATKSKETEQSAIKSRDASVNIMTLHSAKGLEFDTVFFVGIEDGIVPLAHIEDKQLTKKEKQKRVDEERRLFYVGVTRAKKRLYLSFADERLWWGEKKVHNKLSPFLRSIPKKYYIKGSHVSNIFKLPIHLLKKIVWWFK